MTTLTDIQRAELLRSLATHTAETGLPSDTGLTQPIVAGFEKWLQDAGDDNPPNDLEFEFWRYYYSSNFLLKEGVKVRKERTVSTGNGSSVTVGFEISVSGIEHRDWAIRLLDRMISESIQTEAVNRPTEAARTYGNVTDEKAAVGANTERIDITEIVVTHDGKQKRVNVKGGKYTQFGVPLYKDAPFLDEKDGARAWFEGLELGTTAYKGYAIIEIVGGKGKRVLSIGRN